MLNSINFQLNSYSETTKIIWQNFRWLVLIEEKVDLPVTPVLLPGKSHEWRSLAGYSPWGHKESDMT